MPITITQEKFPDGRAYVRAWNEGLVTGDEARVVAARLAAGGDLAGIPMLNVMDLKVEITSDARKIFAAINSGGGRAITKMAMVTASAPMRVTLSFILRLTGQASDTKFFGNEADALAWLRSA